MKKLYQVDAFATERFRGNPAGVCLTDQPLPETFMQDLAAEMNLAETAYVVLNPDSQTVGLRWFTPGAEVQLCGHATLASAHIMFEKGLWPKEKPIPFETKFSGTLTVSWQGEKGILMDFPAKPCEPMEVPPALTTVFGATPIAAAQSDYNILLEFATEQDIRNAAPSMQVIKDNTDMGVVITAKGTGEYDFISRYFAPNVKVNEDPVTGSAHCLLAPYWAQKLNKSHFKAWQASQRGGQVILENKPPRVMLGGTAVTVFETSIEV